MKIDGYTPPSKEVALEQGVTFVYPTEYGEIRITSKMAGRENFAFRTAMSNFDQWATRRKKMTKGGVDEEADRRLAGILYDHLVIEWSTTIKSGGKEIAASRENFIELAMTPAPKIAAAFQSFMEDARDEEHFRPLSAEEAEGNSAAPSDGPSSGATKKTG
jgi:hypothetical protein